MNMSSDLRVALVSFLALIALAMIGCGPQSALQDKDKLPPYLNSTWLNSLDEEQLNLQFVSVVGSPSMVEFKRLDRITNETTACIIQASFIGSNVEGVITVSDPSLFDVEPISANPAPCEWLKTMSSYGINGQTLTIRFNNSQEVKAFQWNPAKHD